MSVVVLVDRRTDEGDGPPTVVGGCSGMVKLLRVVWRALDFRFGFLALGRFEVAIACSQVFCVCVCVCVCICGHGCGGGRMVMTTVVKQSCLASSSTPFAASRENAISTLSPRTRRDGDSPATNHMCILQPANRCRCGAGEEPCYQARKAPGRDACGASSEAMQRLHGMPAPNRLESRKGVLQHVTPVVNRD